MSGVKCMPSTSDEKHLKTDHLKADLKGRSVRGGIATVGGQAAQFVVRLVGMAVLARLLVPEDFGLIAMVTALTGFVLVFKDAGLSVATVQREHIKNDQISTLFWINVAIGVVLMAVVASLGPIIAGFYGRQELIGITLLISPSLLFSGLAIQHQALLQRQMRFTALTVAEIVAVSIALVIAIGLALAGFGCWALASQPVTTAIVLTALAWRLCDWRPDLPRRGTCVRELLAFGGNLTGSRVMAFLSRNLDNVLIGRLIGAGPLGLYARAYSLLMLPIGQLNNPFTNVAVPALSSLQGNSEQFRRYYFRALSPVAFLGFPLVIWLCVAADEIVAVFLGAKWHDCVLIFRLLTPAALADVTNFAVGWVLIPLGQTGRLLRWNVLAGLFLCLCIVLGVNWGLAGVAVAISISHVLLKVPHIWYGYRFSPLRMRDFFKTLAYPFFASLFAASLTYTVSEWIIPVSKSLVLLRFCLLSGWMALFYIAAFLLTSRGRILASSIFADLCAATPSLRRHTYPVKSKGQTV